MLSTLTINKERTEELAGANFATATELADVMVREKNLPFRTAHQIVGRIVSDAIAENISVNEIGLSFSNDFDIKYLLSGNSSSEKDENDSTEVNKKYKTKENE